MSATPVCVSHACDPAPRPRRYRARRPEDTPLYHAVQHHFETWLALKRAGEPWEDTVPAFVERDFRKYLQCGLFCHGFGRARCPRCGHDFLVAFSCRARPRILEGESPSAVNCLIRTASKSPARGGDEPRYAGT